MLTEANRDPRNPSRSNLTSSVEQVQQRTCLRGPGLCYPSLSFQAQNNQKEIVFVATEDTHKVINQNDTQLHLK